MSDEILIALAFIIIPTILMIWDARFSFIAGLVWILTSMFIFYDYQIFYFFIGTGIGLILLFVGVEKYLE